MRCVGRRGGGEVKEIPGVGMTLIGIIMWKKIQ